MGVQDHQLCGIYYQAVMKIGRNALEVHIVEECAELIAAHLRRNRDDRPESLEQFYKECADVSLMVDLLMIVVPSEIRLLVSAEKEKKLARLEKLIEGDGDVEKEE